MRSFRLHTTVTMSILIAACSKEPLTTKPSPGTWQVENRSFKPLLSYWILYDSVGGDNIFFCDDTAVSSNTLSMRFHKKPTAAGTYKLVDDPSADNEVAIQVHLKKSDESYSSDENGTLYVTVENGKLTFKAEEIKLSANNLVYTTYRNCSFILTEL